MAVVTDTHKTNMQKQPIWLVWVDGLPENRVKQHLEYLQKQHDTDYEFRVIESPFHGGKAIEGRKRIKHDQTTSEIPPPSK
jgi:hypothetical protein